MEQFFLIFRIVELNGYYHITDIPNYDEMWVSNGYTRVEYIDAISERIINKADEIFGYIFRHKKKLTKSWEETPEASDGSSSSEEGEGNQTPVACSTKMYGCSQATTSRSYSKYKPEMAVPPEKRRQKVAEAWFNCREIIRIWIPDGPRKADVTPRVLGRTVHISDGEAMLLLGHHCQHPKRQRKPLSASVYVLINNSANTCQAAVELYKKVFEAAQAGSLRNVDMSEITDYNIRYRWLRKERHTYQRDEDLWASAVAEVVRISVDAGSHLVNNNVSPTSSRSMQKLPVLILEIIRMSLQKLLRSVIRPKTFGSNSRLRA